MEQKTFVYGKYNYSLGFETKTDSEAWKKSFNRNILDSKIRKMSYKKRQSFAKKPSKPNITICNIERWPVGVVLQSSNPIILNRTQSFSQGKAVRSVVDSFSDFYGKKSALTKALNVVCCNKKRPDKAFRIAAWTALFGKRIEKVKSVKKNNIKSCGLMSGSKK